MNRSKSLNSIERKTFQIINYLYKEFCSNKDIKLLLLTGIFLKNLYLLGEGKNLCAGGDVKGKKFFIIKEITTGIKYDTNLSNGKN